MVIDEKLSVVEAMLAKHVVRVGEQIAAASAKQLDPTGPPGITAMTAYAMGLAHGLTIRKNQRVADALEQVFDTRVSSSGLGRETARVFVEAVNKFLRGDA